MHIVNVLVAFDPTDQVFPETLSSLGFCDFKCSQFLDYLPASSSQAPSQATLLIPPAL